MVLGGSSQSLVDFRRFCAKCDSSNARKHQSNVLIINLDGILSTSFKSHTQFEAISSINLFNFKL